MNIRSTVLLIAIVTTITISSVAVFAQEKPLKVISYNVLEGFRNDSTLKTTFVSWIKPKAPDIMFFQEMNKFTQKSLEALALRYGHPYAVLSKEGGYPVAITSKYPIVNVQKVVDNMWHSYISANVRGINVFAIHFSPHLYEKRHLEVDQILYEVSLLPKGSKVIIAGDFNSYSAKDSTLYTAEVLAATKASEAKLPHTHNLNKGNFDYYVPESIERAGLVDTFWELHGTEKKPYNRRIDFVFVSKNLAKMVSKSEFVIDEVTKMLSDHKPMFVEFNAKK